MTHSVPAISVNRIIENQSIAALVLRCSVGSAKAASTASPGSPSSSARSEPPITKLLASATPATTSGTDTWRCCRWCRQRHRVHRASSQAGHMNQIHMRPVCSSSLGLESKSTRQAQAPSRQASSEAATRPSASQGTRRRTCA